MWVCFNRYSILNFTNHILILLRTSDRKNVGVKVFNGVSLTSQTTGYNHLAIFIHSLGDGPKALITRTVNKAASVHNNHIRPIIGRRNFITSGAKLGQNPLRINKRLRTPQTNKPNLRRTCSHVIIP